MNLIPKKITPANLKRDGVYFKILQSGEIARRNLTGIFERREYKDTSWVSYTIGDGDGIQTPGGEIDYEMTALAFCRWADGVVEEEP